MLTTMASGRLKAVGVASAFVLPPHSMMSLRDRASQAGRQCAADLCDSVGAEPSRLTTMEQVHGTAVAVIDEALVGRRVAGVDGLVVSRADVPLAALSADCPIVVVCDSQRPALGIAHAGWRGTVGGIARRLVETMIAAFGCRPSDLVAAIAPSAGPCCYEVGPDVMALVHDAWPRPERFFRRHGERALLDLWAANVAQLADAGLGSEQIDLAARCTICDTRFFSYRRDGARCGHAAAVAMLR